MTEVISVRFRNRGKSYFFAPGEHKIETGQYVVVETSKGLACGECVQRNHFVPEDRVKEPLQPVIRPANAEDMKTLEANRENPEIFEYPKAQRLVTKQGDQFYDS